MARNTLLTESLCKDLVEMAMAEATRLAKSLRVIAPPIPQPQCGRAPRPQDGGASRSYQINVSKSSSGSGPAVKPACLSPMRHVHGADPGVELDLRNMPSRRADSRGLSRDDNWRSA